MLLYSEKPCIYYFQSLTELDVSENNIENLDLSAVGQLQILQCSRNSLTTLTIHGRRLTSVIAGNNSRYTVFLISTFIEENKNFVFN